ncbi:MAG: 23S rRNA (adenine(2503)-C(2))-methyltransferase [Candidatus Nealsonbacteria bacterium RIFCSPLOWO2_12_FULL_39_31]|uniref:Probable dual-specificity RNA methyltransferase RlmN n=3 Tax=Candidatus Nealsoniibacteriota TaxID=1817911 RepID=A0A1G2EI98_9BACT|nr:MAG: Ribosomal RNA large subunit methyltransferase N [Parcubacteria group bacterium GW2011_GWA2_38_27]KKQ97589.1 MAG: Ribosomal RNA large subunit methyltransferase N [Parcubacteria group bacterium GW2011_GWC2_39_11]OGZ19410.1 MAG: 23S rRNA (adenine(2503)-C(2))-methyltransferase [Candidatus Nealsonbacteria bacterium RIFCSPHIGHO2_01_FULL_38_55]OGZ20792.1 MAG: 23S rRNA (adenine(2503)-C(2))-methyltransferase [Candidatus Nealsonbacteria bacterium RIFCSPHIGHO2_02_38_10]OGZ21681.1 MAG: 23S rRNA (ad
MQWQELFNAEPKYRLGQAKSALFQDLIQNWQEARVLPLDLREELNKKCPIKISAEKIFSKDERTIKAVIFFDDGLLVETVLMRHKDKRNTICVSSQIGCSLNCSFCATGKIGFKRNLDAWEIVSQVLFFVRYLKTIGEKITNVVFMGMGEPFLNYQNVIGAIKILNDKEGFNLGARHFSISTVGIVEGIEKLAKEELQINLAISLHAPADKLRSELIPVNKKYTIDKILKAVDDYIKKTCRRVMFEYIMIDNINDSKEHAKALAKLMKKPLYFVNLISYNSMGSLATLGMKTPLSPFKSSSSSKIEKFKKILESEGVAVTRRYRFGEDITGACGQLATKNRRK